MLLEHRLQLVIFFLRVHIQYTYSSSEYYSVYSDFYFHRLRITENIYPEPVRYRKICQNAV
jgi:hypothetical protein